MSQSDLLIVNGWALLQHPCFSSQVDLLRKKVAQKKRKEPLTYTQSQEVKLLAAILKLTTEVIPRNPNDASFRQGKSLGSGSSHWYRAKFFQQYRLFFRFDSTAKIIIYAWVNDEDTKRAFESKTDAYVTFQKMLNSGNPPSSWEELLSQASPL